ncbi:MAG: exonuclease domain-containing protein [Candidatus Cyclobacteriaceae bacterium M3_2C_046]
MYLNLKNPLVFFDLETTGTNISQDKIVELSFVKMTTNEQVVTKTMRINPQIPIPVETSLIHGIYDEDVKDAPPFKAIAKELARFLEGCDLSGYNIVKFDVPMLVEEFLRANVDFEVSSRKLIDAQKIFHLMEKRTLSAAYKFYCNKDLTDAHSAEADTKATLEILEAQVKRYENMPVTDLLGNHIGVIENNMESLHKLTCDNMVDLAGRIILKDGIEVFNFGKHKNKPVQEVMEKEPNFYDWMMKGDFPLDTKRKLTQIKLKGFNLKK